MKNLQDMNRDELTLLIQDAKSQLVLNEKRRRAAFIEETMRRAKDADLDFNKLFKVLGEKPTSAPMYANPANKKQTWSGKGRQPAWFKAAVEQGHEPADMKIS